MKQKVDEAVERLDAAESEDALQVFLHKQRYDFTLSRLSKKDKVLEIGTGVGYFSQILAAHCLEYLGLEFDGDACLLAQNRVQGRGKVIQGDAQKLPFADCSCTGIVCLEVLEHLPDFRRAVKEMHRCLQPGGQAIISVPYRKHGGKNPANPYHLYEPGEAELREAFLGYFTEVRPSYQYFEETRLMTLARVCRMRRFLGLARTYAELSRGAPAALEKIKIADRSEGYNFTLLLEVSGRRGTVQ